MSRRRVPPKLSAQEKSKNSKSILHPKTPQVEFTSVSSTGRSVRHIPLGPSYAPPLKVSLQEPVTASPETEPAAPSPPQKKPQSHFLNEFMERGEEVTDLVTHKSYDPLVGSLCGCNSGRSRTTGCEDCNGYRVRCNECFIESHKESRFHWAKVWDDRGFFVRKDISTLRDGGYATTLGHGGEQCPTNVATAVAPLLARVVHLNGVHGTLIHFCHCSGVGDKFTQMKDDGLFPGSAKDPETCFTTDVLRHFHLLSNQSKISAYDYFATLQRLTDNVFTRDVQDAYQMFVRATRLWAYFKARLRCGQLHGIDEHLPNRPKGNLVVYCPVCPEQDLNLEEDWDSCPDELRHLHATRLTSDGNHKALRYAKNKDPDQVSLWDGKGYFPDDTAYRSWLYPLPATSEKSTCTYLDVVNKQDKKKFHNCDITGIVNTQCDHCVVSTSVDMYLGERQFNVDYALAHTLRQRPFHPTKAHPTGPHFCHSYDCQCQYSVKIDERFDKYLPDQAPRVKKFSRVIPFVHIHNHKDDCIYEFYSGYMCGMGHFHGETAEMYWPELNQLGSRTSQMNNPHRQDTINDHHSDWNWRKEAGMSTLLRNELITSWETYLVKRDHLKALSITFKDHLDAWTSLELSDNSMERLYRHQSSKVPSFDTLSNYYKTTTSVSNSDDDESEVGVIGSFLLAALSVQKLQHKLRRKRKEYVSHPSQALGSEIERLQTRLSKTLAKWRNTQRKLTPLVADEVVKQTASLCAEEVEKLFLPSDFEEGRRKGLGMVVLGVQESKIREAEVFDTIRSLRSVSKALTAMRLFKEKQDSGQRVLTRTGDKLRQMEEECDSLIEYYNAGRTALITLGSVGKDDLRLPPLTVKDTFRKPTGIKKMLGDSGRHDGNVWNITAARYEQEDRSEWLDEESPDDNEQKSQEAPAIETGMSKRTASTKRKLGGTANSPTKRRRKVDPKLVKEDGWIWAVNAGSKMTDEEMAEWDLEGDRVQWQRAKAEMFRWLENHETKHAEFYRLMKTFGSKTSIWKRLAISASTPGKAAFARKQAAIFERLGNEASATFQDVGHKRLKTLREGETLASAVLEVRERELAWMKAKSADIAV